jgi:ribonuclease HI
VDAVRLVVHVDGSCLGPAGPGGWAALIDRLDARGRVVDRAVLTGRESPSTNNRMELAGAIAALARFPALPATIVSDSRYLVIGITQWVGPWRMRGWKNGRGRRVANRDLWRELDALAAGRDLEWVWTKGHSGDPANEAVDALARAAAGGA